MTIRPLVCVVLLAIAGCTADTPSARLNPVAAQAFTTDSIPSAAWHPRGSVATLRDHGDLVGYAQRPSAVVRGAYTWYPVALSEEHALKAIGTGVMTVTKPDGGRINIRYERRIEHPDGNWTWIGRVQGGDPGQEAILTFGERAAFGSIPNGDDPPLRLTTSAAGQPFLVATNAHVVGTINNAVTRPRRPDYLITPHFSHSGASQTGAAVQASVASVASAGVAAVPTVDLAVGYTTGFAAGMGGDSQARTRITYLVDVTNQAYVNSKINAQVRLVKTVSVNYTDASSNDATLESLTGYRSGVGAVTPDPAFSSLRAARDQYGADLVVLLRKFNDPENGGCGTGWLIGGGMTGISQSDSSFGYSVVSDGSDVGSDGQNYYCLDESFAHELGHNMGSAHDRETAKGTDGVLDTQDYGVFAYSFGYKTTTASGNFYTVMAYGDSGQTRYRIFSNPRVTTCGGLPCGVDNAADNARSLTQMIPIVATFRATVVPVTSLAIRIPYEVNHDGKSDILLRGDTSMAYWGMSGWTVTSSEYLGNAGTGYRYVTAGDFDGDGSTDIVWADASQIRIWFNTGRGSYVNYQMGSYGGGWVPFASGDINGDGKDDLIFKGGTAIAYWLVDGATVIGNRYAGDGGAGYRVVAVGDFDGNGSSDLMWADATHLKEWLNDGSGSFSPVAIGSYGGGWIPFSAGDINRDGKSDLFFRGGSAMAYWLLNGPTVLSSSYAGDMGAGYVPFAIADYDGDGSADVGWADGYRIGLWLNNGSGNFTAHPVGTYACCWIPTGNAP